MEERTRIKLCGLMSEEDVCRAVTLQPDYIGFILSPAFRRYANPALVKVWRSRWLDDRQTRVPNGAMDSDVTIVSNPNSSEGEAGMKKPPQVVGVFVNEEPDYVIRLLREGVIDIAQLHGQEDNQYVRQIQETTDKKVIKAFTIRSEADVTEALQSPADHILLDAGTGEGQSFNWKLAAGISRDFFLAGGLTPENVAEAITQVHPYAVDVSSGIETDGKKDPVRMKDFVENVRMEG